jgi:hypothetical protein
MEDVGLKPNQKFSEVVDLIEPLLQRGAANATGARKADLLSHIGWGIFLRHRDGFFAGDPEQLYKEALKADAHNSYALANWGHWELWNGSDHLESAEQHFRSALAAGTRARPYVRKIQLSALENNHYESCEAELLRQVNDMRKHGEPIDERTKSDVYSIYYFTFAGNEQVSIKKLLTAAPPAEQVTTFQALFFVPDFDSSKIPSRQAYLAFLQEAAGQSDESSRTLAALRLRMKPRDYDYLVTATAATVKRISAHH